MDKVAKIIEEKSPELAVKLFQQAADVSSVIIILFTILVFFKVLLRKW